MRRVSKRLPLLGAIEFLSDERAKCQPKIVSGLTMVATSCRACLLNLWPIAASVLRAPSRSRRRPLRWFRRMRFSVTRYSLRTQQFLIDAPSHVRQQVFPVHRLPPQPLPFLLMLSMGESGAEDKPERERW